MKKLIAIICALSLEFDLTDKSKLDGLVNGDEIEVTGVFDAYNEGDFQYFYLTQASLNVI